MEFLNQLYSSACACFDFVSAVFSSLLHEWYRRIRSEGTEGELSESVDKGSLKLKRS